MSNSSTSSSKRSPVAGVLKSAGFLGGFVALLSVLNAAAAPRDKSSDIWYGPVIDAVSRGYHPNFLFIGTSRTRAAIHPETWDRAMQARFAVATYTINLGMGWCTPMEHFHGLRALVESNPTALRGTAVLIEAGEGLGQHDRWEGNWIVEDRRDLLVPYLHPTDFPRILKSATPGEAKFAIASDLWFPAFGQMARLRHLVRSTLDTVGLEIHRGLFGKPAAPTDVASDLSTEGGIRADRQGVELAMFLADSLAREDLRDQKPWSEWDSTVIADIARLVKESGGFPVFVRIPYSPTQAAPLATAQRQLDRISFSLALRKWGLPPVVASPWVTRAEDFPDKWHLRKTLAPEFTAQLAQAYLEAFAPKDPSPPVHPDGN